MGYIGGSLKCVILTSHQNLKVEINFLMVNDYFHTHLMVKDYLYPHWINWNFYAYCNDSISFLHCFHFNFSNKISSSFSRSFKLNMVYCYLSSFNSWLWVYSILFRLNLFSVLYFYVKNSRIHRYNNFHWFKILFLIA